METAKDLSTLGRLLQERLHSHSPQQVPLQISCAIKQGILLILGQHPAEVMPNPQEIFQVLESALQDLKPNLAKIMAGSTAQNVRLYLRVIGQKQPYESCRLTMTELGDVDGAGAEVDRTPPLHNPISVPTLLEADDAVPIDPPPSGNLDPTPSNAAQSALISSPDDALATLATYPNKLPLQLLGVGVGLALVTGAIFALTRPCVLGDCPTLQNAQQLDRELTQTLGSKPPTIDNLRQQLIKTQSELQKIPVWSAHWSSAQTTLQTYQLQIQALDPLMAAQVKATVATQKAANPPHPVQEWATVQKFWQEAIAQLQRVPPNSHAAVLTQQKLPIYQNGLTTARYRFAVEQQAMERLNKAKGTAQVAETLQGVAQNLENWQRVEATWQAVVASLRKISVHTTAHQPARELLTQSQAQLVAARNRKTKEQLAVKAYKQATLLAQQAQNFAKAGQWSQSIARWREALANATQVPTDTFYSNQAKPLVGEYTLALDQAENQLKVNTKLQQIRVDLNRTCGGIPRICDFSVTPDLVRVRFTQTYMQSIFRTALTAQATRNVNAQVSVNQHLRSLQAALETISDNSGVAIEIYNATGSYMGKYNPR